MIDISPSDVVYIAGPIAGRPDGNSATFARAEAYLREHCKCEVINPTRRAPGLSYCEYMAISMLDLDKCTCVALLPDWITSIGAGCERAVARRVGLQVYHLPPEAVK